MGRSLREAVVTLLSDEKVKVATITLALAVCAVYGLSAEGTNKVIVVVIGIFGLGTTVIASLGYVQGKNLEGSVPPGRQPSSGTTIQMGHQLETVNPADPSQVAGPADPAAAIGQAQPLPAGAAPGAAAADLPLPPRSNTGAGLTGLSLILTAVLLITGGCGKDGTIGGNGAGSTVIFAQVVRPIAQTIARELTAYAAAIPATDAAAEERKARLDMAATELQDATANPAETDAGRVGRAWAVAGPLWKAQVNADATLTAGERSAILSSADRMDELLAAESKAKKALRIAPPMSGQTTPPGTVPAG